MKTEQAIKHLQDHGYTVIDPVPEGPIMNPVNGVYYWFATPEFGPLHGSFNSTNPRDVLCRDTGRIYRTRFEAEKRLKNDHQWLTVHIPTLSETIKQILIENGVDPSTIDHVDTTILTKSFLPTH